MLKNQLQQKPPKNLMDNVNTTKNTAVTLVAADRVAVNGELTFTTITDIVRRAEQIIHTCPNVRYVDLQAVTRSDSAGLGLLIDLIRTAKQDHNKDLHFINVPLQLAKLAKFSGVDCILFTKEPTNHD